MESGYPLKMQSPENAGLAFMIYSNELMLDLGLHSNCIKIKHKIDF